MNLPIGGLGLVGTLMALAVANSGAQTPSPATPASPALPVLRIIAPTNNAMPVAGFAGDRLVDGITKDLGELLAQRLGRSVRFQGLPSRRVSAALAQGEGDAICYVLPLWLEGDFNWTRALIQDASLVASNEADAPALKGLAALAGVPLGTVLGYRYPRVEQTLGSAFIRSEATSMGGNLRKLVARRVGFALVEKTSLDYHLRLHPSDTIKPVWQIERFAAACAFSKRSSIPMAEVNKAVEAILSDGSVEHILARYR